MLTTAVLIDAVHGAGEGAGQREQVLHQIALNQPLVLRAMKGAALASLRSPAEQGIAVVPLLECSVGFAQLPQAQPQRIGQQGIDHVQNRTQARW